MLQGEVFSAIGLEVVLGDPAARTAFAALLDVDGDIAWQSGTPVVVPGGATGFLDLVGLRSGGDQTTPVCVIEAKIHHVLDELQLRQYAVWLEAQGAAGAVLGVLVPETRRREAELLAAKVRRTVAPRVTVVTWEGVFAVLDGAALEADRRNDFDQLMALYYQYDAAWVQPFTPHETSAEGWENRRADYKCLADQLTLQLRQEVMAVNGVAGRVLTLVPEGHRHVRLAPSPDDSHLALGLFSNLKGGVPFAIRFRPADVPRFAETVDRLEASALRVERGPAGEVFVRLDVPAHSTQPEMLAQLRLQLTEVIRAALPELGQRLAA